jgi:large subunit ribosomal protein L9
MPSTLELLLTENVDNLGIVGDVVRVRSGYARNYLLPRGLCMAPSEEAIKSLAAKRAEAEKQRLRQQEMRSEMVEKLEGFEVHLERSCNDQGLLYGSVTQKDIADALDEQGFSVRARDVRLAQTIKRLDTYDVLVKFDAELSANIKVWVIPDRELESEDDEREEMEFDNEGNLIEKPKSEPAAAKESEEAAASESPAA